MHLQYLLHVRITVCAWLLAVVPHNMCILALICTPFSGRLEKGVCYDSALLLRV